MKASISLERLTFILIGVSIVLSFLFLTGVKFAPGIGRYQMEVVARGDSAAVYVMDTSTGLVKWVDENKPFEQVKSK